MGLRIHTVIKFYDHSIIELHYFIFIYSNLIDYCAIIIFARVHSGSIRSTTT
jgi:hypothetical protein